MSHQHENNDKLIATLEDAALQLGETIDIIIDLMAQRRAELAAEREVKEHLSSLSAAQWVRSAASGRWFMNLGDSPIRAPKIGGDE